MLNWEAKMNIRDLHKQGYSMRAIARITGHARTTVSRVLHPKRQKPPQKRGRKSRIEPFQDYLRERYLTTGLSGVRVYEEIRQMGYTGAVDAVYRFLRSVDQTRQTLTKATVRFETAPGEQAQVDWAECGYYQRVGRAAEGLRVRDDSRLFANAVCRVHDADERRDVD